MAKHKPWKWDGLLLRDARNNVRAQIWDNGTWHTFDTFQIGGENGVCENVIDAKDQAVASVIRQGWTCFRIE